MKQTSGNTLIALSGESMALELGQKRGPYKQVIVADFKDMAKQMQFTATKECYRSVEISWMVLML